MSEYISSLNPKQLNSVVKDFDNTLKSLSLSSGFWETSLRHRTQILELETVVKNILGKSSIGGIQIDNSEICPQATRTTTQ